MKQVLIIMLAVLIGCVPQPIDPGGVVVPFQPGGQFVLCEGLWRQDNSVVSYIDPSGSVTRDLVGKEQGMKLGDTGTDMVVFGDSLIIAVSTSKTLAVISRSTGKWLGSTLTVGGREPYRLASGEGKLYVTNLNDDSISEFDMQTMSVTIPRIPVGPAPEGVAFASGKVWVAVSGLGDLRKDEVGAGTLQVLSAIDLTTVAVIDGLPNAAEVIADTDRGFVYASYRHYASVPDSLGGVVKINGSTNEVLARYPFKNPTHISLDPISGDVYVLTQHGVERIGADGSTDVVIEHESAGGNFIWYSMWYDPTTANILVGNARTFVTDGEVLTINKAGEVLQRSPVGLNPTAFAR